MLNIFHIYKRLFLEISSDYTTIGCLPLLFFFNLEPLENVAKTAKKYNLENLVNDSHKVGLM